MFLRGNRLSTTVFPVHVAFRAEKSLLYYRFLCSHSIPGGEITSLLPFSLFTWHSGRRDHFSTTVFSVHVAFRAERSLLYYRFLCSGGISGTEMVIFSTIYLIYEINRVRSETPKFMPKPHEFMPKRKSPYVYVPQYVRYPAVTLAPGATQ